MDLFEHHLITFYLLEIGLCQKLRSKFLSFFQLCSYYSKCIHHFLNCAAPLTTMRRKHLFGNVVHTQATKSAFETLKSRMIFAPILLNS